MRNIIKKIFKLGELTAKEISISGLVLCILWLIIPKIIIYNTSNMAIVEYSQNQILITSNLILGIVMLLIKIILLKLFFEVVYLIVETLKVIINNEK